MLSAALDEQRKARTICSGGISMTQIYVISTDDDLDKNRV